MNSLRNLSRVAVVSTLFLNINLSTPLITPAQSQVSPAQNQTSQFQTLVEADKLYLLGKKSEAEKLYRQVKAPLSQQVGNQAQPITDPQKLSSSNQVYWRTAQLGVQQNLDNKIFVPLQSLIEKQPEFIPAYGLLAEALQKSNRQKEALEVLEKAVNQFPDSAQLTQAQIKALEADKQWLEASVAARSFAIVYPDNSASAEFIRSADEDLKRFRRNLKEKTISTGILGSIAGILTGRSEETALQLAPLLLKGESGVGSQLAKGYKKQVRLVKDPVVVDYVNKVGQDVAKLMNRNFEYEFYVVQDNSINAFALPGGKVFVNTGAILACNSEAELAGLLAHEIAHSVLSHGFQKIVETNLLANLRQALPLGNILTNLANAQYSQAKERQADIVGTRVIAAAGYAADGLWNVMNNLQQQEYNSTPAYLSTHPATERRVKYLEELIKRNGYNRYAFEGVEKHAAIQKRLRDW